MLPQQPGNIIRVVEIHAVIVGVRRGQYLIAHLQRVGVAQRDDRQPVQGDLQDGQVRVRVGADYLCLCPAAVVEHHLDFVGALSSDETFQRNFDDLLSAINGASVGINPMRLAIGGDSAGGNFNPPTGLVATSDGSNIQLSWIAPAGSTPDGYYAYLADNASMAGALLDHTRTWTVNVMYYGALHRQDYLKHLVQAQLLLYPCEYDELFCIAVAEAQVAGCWPVTSATGALATTNMGTVVGLNAADSHNDAHYIDAAVERLSQSLDCNVRQQAIDRFRPETILRQWDQRVFGGGA